MKGLLNKRVFITGADGFIGSHLAEELIKLGAKVKALVYYNSWGKDGWLNDIPGEIYKELEIVRGDVRDSDFVINEVRGSETIFHLASLIAIPYSYLAPRSYVDTNISGTLNVLQACLKNPYHQNLIHFSTSEVYGTAQTVPIKESHPLVAQSPYSASKIAADKLVESFYNSFELRTVTARPFNTFGPRQTTRAVIPTIISQILNGQNVLKLGDTSPTRDFNYVTDTVKGAIQLAISENLEGKTINIGSGKEISILEVAELVIKKCGSRATIETEEVRMRPKNSEVHRLIADNAQLKHFTKWDQSVTFDKGLDMTIDWFRKNKTHYVSGGFSV